jgi:hypothetical protein
LRTDHPTQTLAADNNRHGMLDVASELQLLWPSDTADDAIRCVFHH